MPLVKVCGVTREADAWLAIEAGATAIGLNFWPRSPRFVEPQSWMWQLPVLKVGIFVGAVAETWGLDIAQVYGDATPPGVRLWRGVKPGDPRHGAEAYVMDVSEGTGRTFDWTLAWGLHEPIVLAGGLDGSNVGAAIEVARPWGVDACSRLESAPGVKDAAKVKAFVTAAKEAFAKWD